MPSLFYPQKAIWIDSVDDQVASFKKHRLICIYDHVIHFTWSRDLK